MRNINHEIPRAEGAVFFARICQVRGHTGAVCVHYLYSLLLHMVPLLSWSKRAYRAVLRDG